MVRGSLPGRRAGSRAKRRLREERDARGRLCISRRKDEYVACSLNSLRERTQSHASEGPPTYSHTATCFPAKLVLSLTAVGVWLLFTAFSRLVGISPFSAGGPSHLVLSLPKAGGRPRGLGSAISLEPTVGHAEVLWET